MNKNLELFLTFMKIGVFTFGGGYAIISILVNATSRQQVNSELCKILPGENVSKIIKQFQPLLKDLP